MLRSLAFLYFIETKLFTCLQIRLSIDIWKLSLESCRSKQARYTNLATHLTTQPHISLLSHPSPYLAPHLPT